MGNDPGIAVPPGDLDEVVRDDVPARVRSRIGEALAVVVGVVATGGALAFAVDLGRGGGPAVAAVLAATALAALGIGTWMTRRAVRPVEDLGERLRQTRDAYDRARLDARVDPLTGLGNHRAFQEELGRQVAESQRGGCPLALAILDLDDLKRLNDTEGHSAGDQLLAALGRLVRATVRPTDRAFRVGGDEFALLLPDTTAETAFGVVRRLLASATGGHPVLHGTPRFSFSAGITSCPSPSGDAIRLARHADAALYWAKRHGRTDIQVFDAGRHGAAGDERTGEELAEAITRVAAERLLRPVYQPIVSLATGRIAGYEGLVRPGPDSGFPNAERLFAAAEAADRIVELDMAAIETVAAHVDRLQPGQYLSLNMSPRTLETEQFRVGDILGVLRRYALDPHQVVIELTEREEIEDLARLKANLDRVRAAGFRLAVDDVGAGNAGLRLLSEIAFDIVKIDLSLVQKGVLQESSLAVLRALHDMADRWGAIVVAEGVETPEQLVAIRHLRLTAGQGYLLGRPRDHADARPVDLDLIASMSNLAAADLAS